MVQAAFFDIDGTLLDHTGGKSVFPPSAAAALAALQRKGAKVFISTGRSPAMLEPVWGLFPFDGYVTMNGQLVLEGRDRVIHRLAHDPGDVRRLVSLAREKNIPGYVQEETETFPLIDHPAARWLFEWMKAPVPPVYDPERLAAHPVLQFNLCLPLEESIGLLEPFTHMEITSSGGDIQDVIPKGGGKEVGLNTVVGHYGFRREDTIAFGDGLNDVRMLKWAGIGVAMGNGPEEVKAAADYTTTAVSDDGIKNALLHLGILSPEDFEDMP